MKITLKEVKLPEFGIPEECPLIPASVYEQRCEQAYRLAGCDWLAVYGDREHAANICYLTGFDPRFEEALFLVGPNKERYLLVGNEGIDYAKVTKIKAEIVLYQSFGLPGQDRSLAPRLDSLLTDFGMKRGDTVGIVGWKYAQEDEQIPEISNLFVPAIIADCLARQTGIPVRDVTRVLMHPTEGMRAISEVEQIAAFEWGAARASAAVNRIVRGVKIGMTEYQAMANMQYMGEPMTCHPMFSASKERIIGLSSPNARPIEKGDGATTAIAYWGGLSCRAGLIDDGGDDFLNKLAIPYYKAVAHWYQHTAIGKIGGELFDEITNLLAEGNLKQALNPGHQTHIDEWMNSLIRPQSHEAIQSGMMLQLDIIPVPMPNGIAINCEDSVAFADESLRNQLKQQYPQVWKRIEARQSFIRNEIGIPIDDSLLPLSSNAAYFSPFWLTPNRVLAVN